MAGTNIYVPKISPHPQLSRRFTKTSQSVQPRLLSNYCLCLGTWSMRNFCVPVKNRVPVSYNPLVFLYTSYTVLLCQIFCGLIFQVNDFHAKETNWSFILALLIIKKKKICISVNFTWYLLSSPQILSLFTSH